MGSPFSSSPLIVFVGCGPGGDEESQRGKCPPPDSDPFTDAEFAKNLVRLSRQLIVRTDRRLKNNERSQLFLGTHNEALTVAAMRVSN
jgi:hypothetical protein